MYIKYAVVECYKSKLNYLFDYYNTDLVCLIQIRLLSYTGQFEHCLDILYFLEKINCPIDDQLIIAHKSSKQAMCLYLLCLTNSLIFCIPLT